MARGVTDGVDEEDGKRGVKNHLQDRVYSDEDSAVLAVAAGETSPNEYHGNTAGESDEDESFAETRLIGEESPR